MTGNNRALLVHQRTATDFSGSSLVIPDPTSTKLALTMSGNPGDGTQASR